MSVFNLDTLETVLLKREFEPEPAVADIEAAKIAVGGDIAKLMAIINAGLVSEQARKLKEDIAGWMEADDEGKFTIPFAGSAASEKVQEMIDGTILQIAKMSFGYQKGIKPTEKQAAKKAATDFLISQPILIAGIKARAAAEKSTT
jgi:hypothetical protein